ncbi:MAG: lipid-A-disaccharide synthase [Gammaproteobacteria bacterium SHHR-1]|uniref:lipid-A-disaccharide synthase n=1 Tax=Magnetovirga frankeli TaxID=947516 RepID=UPI0012940921|nr:lipid-A-disaccharide synthase [gamma proteobacterium SS-5]
MLRIAIMAYEVSADRLGEGLLLELRQRLGAVEFEGVVGARLQDAGCRSLLPPEELALMGLFEVLRHLPRLLRARRQLARHFLASRPDLFIGIDAPDFNLALERQLRAAGIPTVHYVSPSFWAWRQGRVRILTQACDLVLSIFPFELEFLQKHGVNARYVGHPLAQQIPLQIDRAGARARLGLTEDDEVLALLPGSRGAEIKRLTGPFIQAVRLLLRQRPGLRLILPLAGASQGQQVRAQLAALADPPPIQLLDDSHLAMAAADLLLTASGTATIEGLMHKRPMVVAYRMNGLSFALVRRLLRVPWVAMANLLAQAELAPEFIQERCQPQALADALLALLEDPERRQQIAQRYAEIHAELRLDSARLAADAVLELLRSRGHAL